MYMVNTLRAIRKLCRACYHHKRSELLDTIEYVTLHEPETFERGKAALALLDYRYNALEMSLRSYFKHLKYHESRIQDLKDFGTKKHKKRIKSQQNFLTSRTK